MARRLIVLFLIVCAVVASGFAFVSARETAPASSSLRSVTIGMGYVPNVQFAPFYVALQQGFYRKAGLDVHLSYGVSPNLLQLVAAGRDDFAVADGTDVIAATAQGVPIRSVATLYRRLPVSIFSKKSKGIGSISALRGKTLGVPGKFGSTYVGLLAALSTAGVKPGDLTIKTIGFTQAESVAQGTVDAAVGYSNNEPVRLRRRGYAVQSIEVGAVTNLVGPGLVAGTSLIAKDPGTVRKFVEATMVGLAYTIAHPQKAFAASRKERGLTTLRGRDVGDQYAVLLRSIAFWHDAATRAHGLGYANMGQWRTSIALLKRVGQVPHAVKPAQVVTDRFVDGTPRM